MLEVNIRPLLYMLGFGFFYFWTKPEEERERLYQHYLWKATLTYHKTRLFIKDICSKDEEEEDDFNETNDDETNDDETNEEENKEYELVTYNKDENDVYVGELETINESDTDCEVNKEGLVFLKYVENNKFYLKRLYNGDNLKNVLDNVNVVSKPFMQVDYEDADNKLEIHGELDKFYVSGNKILDYEFLCWYMEHYYQLSVKDDYTIHILDENISMKQLNKDKFVNIVEDKDETYVISE